MRGEYSAYATCDIFDPHDGNRRVCKGGPLNLAGVLKAKEARVRYKVCMKPPDRGEKCFRERTKGARKASQVSFTRTALGKYKFSWEVDGKVEAKDTLKVKA